VRELKKLYKGFQQTQSIADLIAGVEAMRSAYGASTSECEKNGAPQKSYGGKISGSSVLTCFLRT